MNITWVMTGDDPNDLKAEPVKGDMLRVERMGRGYWWYCCYIGEKRFEDNPPHEGTLKRAKAAYEELYKKNKHGSKVEQKS